MSWNGATDVAEWRVLTGSSPDRLAVTTRVPWRGFETAVALPPSAGYVAVEAHHDGGNALDRSKTVEIPKG
jgi:hypothetical protein